jgi:uncharacterized protein
MDLFPTIIPAALILFSGAFVRSALGFGDAVIAMPLLAMVMGIKTATPLVALFATTIASSILIRNWQKVDFQSTWRLILSSLAGIPLGLYFLTKIPESGLKLCLGVLIAGYGIYRLFQVGFFIEKPRWPAFLFGFFAGVLGGAYNTNGPPIVIYGTLKRWKSQDFRATLQGYFLPTGLLIALGHGASGLWTAQVGKLYLICLPCVAAGIFLGGKINRSIRADHFIKIINCVLIGLGLMLIYKAIL